MNTLYIAPYRQKDGWGYASRDYLKAIQSNSKYTHITAQPIYLSSADPDFFDDDIKKLEDVRYDQYDVVIQKTLPECFFVNRNFKYNIGITELETNNFLTSNIVKSINRLDQIWVPSNQEKNSLQKSGVSIPIKVISQPLNIEYIKSLQSYKFKLNPILDTFFKFYFIGDYCERKNISDLIAAFNLAFSYEDRTVLIIKTSQHGVKPNILYSTIQQQADHIKKSLNISNKYKKEIIITDSLSYKDVIGLHNACDCFVMPSYGEAFCRPAAEALACGKTPLVTNNTGMCDYINNSNGFYIKSHQTPVITQQRTLSDAFDMYNANEFWYKPDIQDMAEQMRKIFDMRNSSELKEKSQQGIKSANQFSYTEIGNKLCI